MSWLAPRKERLRRANKFPISGSLTSPEVNQQSGSRLSSRNGPRSVTPAKSAVIKQKVDLCNDEHKHKHKHKRVTFQLPDRKIPSTLGHACIYTTYVYSCGHWRRPLYEAQISHSTSCPGKLLYSLKCLNKQTKSVYRRLDRKCEICAPPYVPDWDWQSNEEDNLGLVTEVIGKTTRMYGQTYEVESTRLKSADREKAKKGIRKTITISINRSISVRHLRDTVRQLNNNNEEPLQKSVPTLLTFLDSILPPQSESLLSASALPFRAHSLITVDPTPRD